MKKRINGHTYNTNTAKLMVSVKGDLDRGGNWYKEMLYETEDHLYFLVGVGGELTRWNGETGLIALDKDAVDFWRKKRNC